jgi:hypothetical protein
VDSGVDNCCIRNDDAGAFLFVFDVFLSSASKQYLYKPREINRCMYYYYIYAYKGDMIRREFVAYKHKQSAQELFDELVADDYDCIVIDDITKDQYIAQEDPYSV